VNSGAFQSRAEIEESQLASLRALISAIGESNAFYRDRLREAGINQSLADLAAFRERVPLTSKDEIARDQETHPPYGTNLTLPLDQYTRIHQTSSTTGSPLRWMDTPESWSAMTDLWVQVFEAAGAARGDRVFAAFSFGPFIGFWLAFEAAVRMGCLTIPGGAMNSVTRLRAILANDVTFLLCTPTYAIRLGEVARDEGIDLSRAQVRRIIVAGEPGGSVPVIRERIEHFWPGARVFDHHGMTEVGPVTFECPARPGTLHIMETGFLAEVIDRDSRMPIEPGSGNIGELVLTTLMRTGSPMLRYATGDLVRPGPLHVCPCGRSTLTLEGGIIGRVDDMVFIRGVNLFPSAVEQIIRQHEGIAEYRVEIDDRHALTELRVLIEPVAGATPADLISQLERAFRNAWNLRIPIELAVPGSLPRFELKSKRWIRLTAER